MEQEKLNILNEQHEAIGVAPVQMSTPKAFGMKPFISGFSKRNMTPCISIFS